ncbi:MAG TPA: tetratricopeptide repeat protein [bacterium]|nr:tetratricopeptide repeat protein [bacterium]
MKIRTKVFVSLLLAICSFVFPEDYASTLDKGIMLLKQGRYEESLETLEEARNISPENSLTYYYTGESLYCLGKTDKAIDNYKKAIEIQPSVPEYYLSLAMLYRSINEIENAVVNLDKVLEIAPKTITGRKARKLKEEISYSTKGKELVKKWVKLEEEEAARLREAEDKAIPQDGLPEDLQGLPVESAFIKEDIRKIIRKIRFETETEKKKASSVLVRYSQAELQQVAEDMIDIAGYEKDAEVKKNIMLALGKAATPESVQLLLGILQDSKELYDIRIVALEGLANTKTEEIIAAERNTLNIMVANREKERKDAQKNIEEITKKLESLQVKKDELSLKNFEQQEKLSQLNMKLQEISMPAEFMDVPPQSQQARISAQELTKLRRDIKALETAITKQMENMSKMDQEMAELQRQKLRYENLLVKREEKKDISFQTRQDYSSAPPPDMAFPDQPPDMYGEAVYVETDEEKNEIIFAVSLIKTLGKMRDVQSLDIIKRGWEEYGVEQQNIYYLLSLARLSDFSGIDALVARLRNDYPAGQMQEELLLRSGIIEAVGDYLLQTPNDRLSGLIEYLSEEGGYPEIRKAASVVLAKIGQRSK